MKKSDVFPSKYLKVADLNGTEVNVTISSVEWEKVGDGEKSVCYFKANKLKPLPLNKTNYESIEAIAGTDETDDWPGTKLTLYPATIRFNGVQTPCVRIKEQRSAAAAPAPQQTLEEVQAAF